MFRSFTGDMFWWPKNSAGRAALGLYQARRVSSQIEIQKQKNSAGRFKNHTAYQARSRFRSKGGWLWLRRTENGTHQSV